MNRKFIALMLIFLCISLSLYGCTNKDENKSLKGKLELKEEQVTALNQIIEQNEEKISNLENEISQLQNKLNSQSNSVLNQALIVVNLLKNKDMITLSDYIHPEKGVRFTPYSYIEIQSNLVFKAEEIKNLMQSTQVYSWGVYDGSGEPIDLTFSDYFDKFIYDVNFAEPDIIGNNTVIKVGNMVNNITQAYPNEKFVEFHFSGFDAKYAGMDWKSIRLVFEKVNETWYLVGIIHDQWTI